MSYEVLIGLRQMKGRNRSHVVSLLTLISILGVGVGVWALTVVLSVLNGFGQDLRQKIITSSPHMVVEHHTEELVQPERLCKKIKQIPQIKECSPFITNEIMLTSPTANAGVLLRGIAEHSTRVHALVKQMQGGKFQHLFAPQHIPEAPRWEPLKETELKPLLRKIPELRDTPQQGLDPDIQNAPAPSRPRNPSQPSPATAPPPKKHPAPQKEEPSSSQKSPPIPSLPPPPVFRTPEETVPPWQPRRRVAPRKNYPGILLGKELAQSLGVLVGDVVQAVSPLGGTLTPMGPAPRTRKFKVAGIFFTGMYEYDTKFAFVTLPNAQRLFKMYDTVTGIELGVTDIYNTPVLKAQVRETIGGGAYKVQDWIEMNSQLFGALKMEKIAMFIILTLIVLVASFNIVSTLTMVVLEKTEEIAILKSMGATKNSMMRVFMIQGIAIGMVGTVMGLFLGWRTCLFLTNHPIPMDTDVYYIATLPVQMNVSDFVAVAVAAVFISFLATLYPALQASRLKPVEGLQHE